MTIHDQFEAGFTANRFRSSADWYVGSVKNGVNTVRIATTGERAVDLVHVLASHLPPEIRVSIESIRDRQAWSSANCARNAARDVLARLKLLLASYGGVEFVLYTATDQLTLTPELEVVIYSRSSKWARHLSALGLEPRETLPAPVWLPSRRGLGPAPELSEAITTAVRRLGLTVAPFEIPGA